MFICVILLCPFVLIFISDGKENISVSGRGLRQLVSSSGVLRQRVLRRLGRDQSGAGACPAQQQRVQGRHAPLQRGPRRHLPRCPRRHQLQRDPETPGQWAAPCPAPGPRDRGPGGCGGEVLGGGEACCGLWRPGLLAC